MAVKRYAIARRAVWDQAIKGRPVISLDNVVEKICKYMHEEKLLLIEVFGSTAIKRKMKST